MAKSGRGQYPAADSEAHSPPSATDMTTPAASLVVPVRDEAGNIAPLVSEIRTALDAAEPKAAAALSVEDFEGAMAALATLRAPIDAFFEGVMVNDPDQDKRAFRLGLLARFRDAVSRVADFSKIEG